VEVRVGLSAGDVAFEDGDVHGTPVIEASRLCGAAVGGEILASEIVRWLAGAQDGPRFIPAGSLELKGLAVPVPAVRVEWEPAPLSNVPMPPLLTDIGRIFVGRDAELERLQQLWKEAAAGERRVALLSGEPGVGKTRLAAEVALRAHEEGAVVIAGRCDEDLGVPYQPFVEALRHFVDHTASIELRERLGRYGGELVRLVPELAGSVGDLAPPVRSDPETERYRLFDAVAAWLTAVSAETPVLVVLDDLQWAARPTLLLLRHIVRCAEPQRLLVLGTYRDTELGPDHPLVDVLADLRRQGGVERLSMTGLDQSGVTAFMASAAGHELDDGDLSLAAAVHAETEGNPFFVREVFRHLSETGALERRGRRGNNILHLADKIGIPESVREVVSRRLARLSDDANRALLVATVAGTEFELGLLQSAGSLGEEVLLSSLEEATAARLIIEAPGVAHRYRFAHALVRDALYGQLSPARRMVLHRRVAEAIETVHTGRLEDHLPALAYHWARGASSAIDIAKAADYSSRAGDRAMAQLAFEAAAAHYEAALAALDGMPGQIDNRRAGLFLALGKAWARGGDPRAAEAYGAAVELARRAGDADAQAGAAVAMADLWAFSCTVDDRRISFLEEARKALGGADSAVTAQVLARLATELYSVPGSWDRRDALSAESIEVARRLGEPRTLATSLHARNYAMWAPGGAHERLALGREIIDLAHQGDDGELALHGHAWCQTALLELGDVAGLDVELGAYERLAEEIRQPRYRWYAITRRTMRALLAGDFDGAERLARVARQVGRDAGEPDVENVFGAQMFVVWHERPSPEALDVMDARCGVAEATLPEESPLVLGLRLMRLLLLLDTTRRDEAHDELNGLVGYAITKLDPTYYGMGWAILAVLLAAAVVRLSLVEAAATLYDLLLPYNGLNVVNCGAVTFDGAYSHHLGMLSASLARWDEAEAHLADAVAVHERMGAHAHLARTRLELARMLVTRRQLGDTARSQELLRQALATARELGLGSVERHSVTLLQERG